MINIVKDRDELMKVCFVHDFVSLQENNKDDFYAVGFSYNIWERYLKVFDELVVISRFRIVDAINNETKSSGPNVIFDPIYSYKHPISLLKNTRRIKKEISKKILSAEGVIIRLPSVLGFLAADICRKYNKPYLVEVVGSAYDSFYYHGNIMGKLLAKPFDEWQKRSTRNAIAAIYVTKDFLQNRYPTNGKKFNGVSNVHLTNIRDDQDVNINNITKIGLVGSTFVKYKGHEFALNVIAKLKHQNINLVLELVGQGMSKDLEKKIKEKNLENNIVYKGVIFNPKLLNDWYRTLDIYIQPSITEGHCRSIVEAIGNNIPTIATNVGGNSDSIDNKFLFELNDEDRAVSLLKNLIQNNDLRLENIKLNKMKIEEFKIEKIERKRTEALNYYKNQVEG